MRKLKDRLHDLDRRKIQEEWQDLESASGLSTREKLEKLVRQNLKRQEKWISRAPAQPGPATAAPFLEKDFSYALDGRYGKVRLGGWLTLKTGDLGVIAGSNDFSRVDPRKVLFFDSETTGLAGGTGTIPFMLGFGFFGDQAFQVKIFVLQDLDREGEFLQAVAEFLRRGGFSATVTFNGKAFDFPLLETRFILQRQRFPLLELPHLDFLFPARTIWKNTYDSRKLGYLGEMLLGLSRGDDIEASSIPALYFGFLRTRAFSLIEPVVDHNALDLIGLAAVVLLGVLYLDDYSLTGDGGEIFGLGLLCERAGLLEKAEGFYKVAREVSARSDVGTLATRRLSVLMKKKRLYGEALELWRALCAGDDPGALREISIHYEHRERNYSQAVTFVEKALASARQKPAQQQEMEKRLERLRKKIARLEESEEISDK
jgi:uncharacterized protein YprB with RNaseH-like and TPR domain